MAFDRGFHRYECGLLDLFYQSHVVWHAFRFVALLGLENTVRFYKDEFAMKTFNVDQYLREHRLNTDRFDTMDKAEQWKAFGVINSFVDHRGQMDTAIEHELWCWAVKVVLLINQQQRK